MIFSHNLYNLVFSYPNTTETIIQSYEKCNYKEQSLISNNSPYSDFEPIGAKDENCNEIAMAINRFRTVDRMFMLLMELDKDGYLYYMSMLERGIIDDIFRGKQDVAYYMFLEKKYKLRTKILQGIEILSALGYYQLLGPTHKISKTESIKRYIKQSQMDINFNNDCKTYNATIDGIEIDGIKNYTIKSDYTYILTPIKVKNCWCLHTIIRYSDRLSENIQYIH